MADKRDAPRPQRIKIPAKQALSPEDFAASLRDVAPSPPAVPEELGMSSSSSFDIPLSALAAREQVSFMDMPESPIIGPATEEFHDCSNEPILGVLTSVDRIPAIAVRCQRKADQCFKTITGQRGSLAITTRRELEEGYKMLKNGVKEIADIHRKYKHDIETELLAKGAELVSLKAIVECDSAQIEKLEKVHGDDLARLQDSVSSLSVNLIDSVNGLTTIVNKVLGNVTEQATRMQGLEAGLEAQRKESRAAIAECRDSIAAVVSSPTAKLPSELTALIGELKEIKKRAESTATPAVNFDAKLSEIKELLSYAEAAKLGPGGAARSANKPTQTIFVKSRHQKDSSQAIEKKIIENFNACELGVGVRRFKQASHSRVVMTLASDSDTPKVREAITKACPELLVENAPIKKPLVVFRRLLTISEEKQVVESLEKQNGDIVAGLTKEEKVMRLLFRRRVRNEALYSPVFEVSTVLYRRLVERGYVHIGVQSVRVEDHSPLVQCHQCLHFGHTKRQCGRKIVCVHCGGEHVFADCQRKADPPRCSNCITGDRKHRPTSYECPERAKFEAMARARVTYC